MNVFIIMPFDVKYDVVYSAIQVACERADLLPVRADEIKEIGPIINHIFDSIENSDFIIAEISEKNQNVYYEVGVAHCMGKPTILLAMEGLEKELPFDVKHNRVVFYNKERPDKLVEELAIFLISLKQKLTDTSEEPVNNLEFEEPQDFIERTIDFVSKKYQLTDAKLQEMTKILEGVKIVVKDAFEEKIVTVIDINGIIKQTRKIS